MTSGGIHCRRCDGLADVAPREHSSHVRGLWVLLAIAMTANVAVEHPGALCSHAPGGRWRYALFEW